MKLHLPDDLSGHGLFCMGRYSQLTMTCFISFFRNIFLVVFSVLVKLSDNAVLGKRNVRRSLNVYQRDGRRLSRVLLVLLLLPLVAQAAGLRVEPERTQMYAGESLTLNIIADGLQGDLSLDALAQDFELLGSSTSSKVTSINGKFTSQKSWRVELMPFAPAS